jgi:hypothetical protein
MSGVSANTLPAAELQKILSAAMNRLHVRLTSSNVVAPGATITASIAGAGVEVDVTDLLDGVLNIDWQAFTQAALGAITDSANSLRALITETDKALPTAGPAPLPNAITAATPAGLLGRLVGAVSLPRLRVRADIRWQVTDSQGNELIEGEDFIAPNGLALPDVLIKIPPLFRELDAFDYPGSSANLQPINPLATPSACTFRLQVRVVLSVGDVFIDRVLSAAPAFSDPSLSTPPTLRHPADLVPDGTAPGIPLIVLPLPVPTLVALFSNAEFNPTDPSPAKLLVVVPHGSPITSLEQLNRILRKIDQVVSDLRQLPFFAASLLGLDLVNDALSGQPGARLVSAQADNSYRDFTKVVYYSEPTRFWWIKIGTQDVTFNDEAMSMVLLGMPGTQVSFFNQADIVKDEGVWHVSVAGAVDFTRPLDVLPFVIVRDLGPGQGPGFSIWASTGGADIPAPETIPPKRSAEDVPANQSSGWFQQATFGWGKRMSSLRFDWLGDEVPCNPPPPIIIQ